jgi:hypothetical protein
MLPNNSQGKETPKMRKLIHSRWTWLVAGNAAALCMLGFYSQLGAAPPAGQPPFANPIDQRQDMIRELHEIKELLKEQNALLRAGADKLGAEKNAAAKPNANPLAGR